MSLISAIPSSIASRIEPQTTVSNGQGSDPSAGFGNLIDSAIKKLDDVQKQADNATLQVATGDSGDLHTALIAVEEASLSFQLALQVRNKIVDGYQEIMRMQV